MELERFAAECELRMQQTLHDHLTGKTTTNSASSIRGNDDVSNVKLAVSKY